MTANDGDEGAPSRRAVLRAAVAVSGTSALAGCSVDVGGLVGGGEGDDTADPTIDEPTEETPSPTASSTDETPSPTASPTATPFPDPDFSQDCLPLDPESVEIEEAGDGYRIVAGESILLAFDEFDNAKQSRDIIKSYGLTEFCFVGRPDPPMSYWLVDGAPPYNDPDGGVENEDCIPFDGGNLQIEETSGGNWRLIAGDSILLQFPNRSMAQRGLDIIQFYGFEYLCFVGRPDPPMTYWLAEPEG